MDQKLTRKDFLKAGLLFASAGATLGVLARCGGSGGSGSGSGSGNGTADSGLCTNGAINGAISNNHGHSLSVPAADVQAAAQKTYNIQGGSAHPHSITITAAQFGLLSQNQTFTVTSTNDAGHIHDVTVRCA